MKKLILLAICCAPVITGYAQDDDVYFVPSKKSNPTEDVTPRALTPSTVIPLTNDTHDYDNWAEHRGNGHWDVDAYNRRGAWQEGLRDSLATDSIDDVPTAEGDCTARIVRFHSPRAGVIVSSPYYADVVDVWMDPWYINPWYSPWSWYTPWYDRWYTSWYGGWYGWGWSCGWGWNYYPGWWYPGPSWGWGGWHHHHHWYPGWGGGHNYWAGNIGPRGGYVGRYGRGGAYDTARPSGNRSGYTRGNTRNGRYNTTTGNVRPSRNFGNTTNGTRPSRTFNNRTTNDRQPSRTFNNNNRTTNDRQPSRSFNNTNRTISPSGGRSSVGAQPSRGSSFGGGHSGGGRSFGGSGSRGGRR